MPASDDTLLRHLKKGAARGVSDVGVLGDIARQTGFDHRTVAKWIRAEALPQRSACVDFGFNMSLTIY